MNDQNTQKLLRDFPKLYSDHDKPMTETAMCWLFECGDGWYDIIYTLSNQLTWLSDMQNADVRASQVKEKYGILSFYLDGSTDIMDACVRSAEIKSARTCELCGNWGRLRGKYWVQTLCDECNSTREPYPLEDKEQ